MNIHEHPFTSYFGIHQRIDMFWSMPMSCHGTKKKLGASEELPGCRVRNITLVDDLAWRWLKMHVLSWHRHRLPLYATIESLSLYIYIIYIYIYLYVTLWIIDIGIVSSRSRKRHWLASVDGLVHEKHPSRDGLSSAGSSMSNFSGRWNCEKSCRLAKTRRRWKLNPKCVWSVKHWAWFEISVWETVTQTWT